MISCIIIEDQPPAQRILKKYITDIGNLELKNTFGDALSALEYLKHQPIELIFLDIHLPKISGIDFLKILSQKPKVILTTAFPNYALESYELDVVDYLLKPFSFERFVKAVSKVNYIRERQPTIPTGAPYAAMDFIFIKTGSDFQKIEIAAIQFIKSNGDYTQIFMPKDRYLVSQPLKYWLDKLNPKSFCRIHKSYLINVSHISKVSGNQIYIGEQILPIGRTYKEEFVGKYLEGF